MLIAKVIIANATSFKTSGKIASVEASRKNKLLNDSSPQFKGEKRLMSCNISGITYTGTHTPPNAANITTEIDPKESACWGVRKNTQSVIHIL